VWENIITSVIDNKEWLFSGVGVLVVSWVVHFLFKKRIPTQTIRSGDGSTNAQAGGDVSIRTEQKKRE